MSQFDEFARTLLEESKRYLEKAQECSDAECESAHMHAALMLGFCSLEAHINSISDDFLESGTLTTHDKGVLSEREVILDNGEFKLTNKLKMHRLEDRIAFIYSRFSTSTIPKNTAWWNELKTARVREFPKAVNA